MAQPRLQQTYAERPVLTDELTELELLTLRCLAKGKNPTDIAVMGNVHRNAICHRLARIKMKLGAATIVQAVVMALTAGLIE